jgi:hypothetical protein
MSDAIEDSGFLARQLRAGNTPIGSVARYAWCFLEWAGVSPVVDSG